MAVTISMIEEKEFKKRMNGYDCQEVNEFLDEICDTMESMQNEIVSLQQRLRQQQQMGAYGFNRNVPSPSQAAPSVVPVPVVPAPVKPEPVSAAKPEEPAEEKKAEPAPEKAESATALLMNAQKLYDSMLADARREAEEIRQKAKDEVQEKIRKIEEDKREAMEEVEMVKAAAKDYRARFKRLLEDQQHVLNAETELFE